MILRRFAIVIAALLASACSTLALNEAEVASLANPPADVAADVATLLPGAIVLVDETEAEIQRRGRPLNAVEARIAQAVGVQHPDKVRVLVHEDFLEPRDKAWLALAREFGVAVDVEEAGRTAGYGIEVKPGFVRSRRTLAHELAHVAQYERLGTPGLLRDYLTQILVVGYDRAPLEVQARASERLR
jgi:hypothetical protein